MSRAVEELQQIPFSQLIGAPLKAAVEAQALAAQSTIEFIHKVGFKQPNGLGAADTDLVFSDVTADADAGDFGGTTANQVTVTLGSAAGGSTARTISFAVTIN